MLSGEQEVPTIATVSTQGTTSADLAYAKYCRWCTALKIKPATKEIYQHEVLRIYVGQ